MSPWRFADTKDVMVVTERQIVHDGAPILHVSHCWDEDGWRFSGSDAPKTEDAVLIHLDLVLRRDPTVEDLADLPFGWRAWRRSVSDPWVREPNPNDLQIRTPTRLTVEDEPLQITPTREQVAAAVDRMSPRGGPGFIILEGAGESYAQAAGGDGRYTAEWREYIADGFRHWKAGLRGRSAAGTVAVPTNGFQVTVNSNEVLSASDVKTILWSFAAGEARPEQYAWRDMTDELLKSE